MRRGAAPLLLGLLLAGSALAAPEFQGRLTGIVIAGALREAILVENGTTHRLHPGDTIDGWTVASVEPNIVTLTAEDATTRLSPSRSLAAEAPPPPAVVPRTHQVSDALMRQQREQAEAEATMAAATAKMEAEKARHRTGATQ